MPALRAQGINVRCITADGKGDHAAVKKLLKEKGAVVDDLDITSDPKHKTLALGPASLFVAAPRPDNSYTMVQPAVVVLDGLKVVSSWSWKSMGSDDAVHMVTSLDGVKNSTPLEKETYLVTIRPSATDLIEAINEGRDIGLESVMYFGK